MEWTCNALDKWQLMWIGINSSLHLVVSFFISISLCCSFSSIHCTDCIDFNDCRFNQWLYYGSECVCVLVSFKFSHSTHFSLTSTMRTKMNNVIVIFIAIGLVVSNRKESNTWSMVGTIGLEFNIISIESQFKYFDYVYTISPYSILNLKRMKTTRELLWWTVMCVKNSEFSFHRIKGDAINRHLVELYHT